MALVPLSPARRSNTSHPTLITLATLVDNLGVHAISYPYGSINEHAPGIPDHEEQQLDQLAQSATTKLVQLET